jgi:hypothetical protein
LSAVDAVLVIRKDQQSNNAKQKHKQSPPPQQQQQQQQPATPAILTDTTVDWRDEAQVQAIAQPYLLSHDEMRILGFPMPPAWTLSPVQSDDDACDGGAGDAMSDLSSFTDTLPSMDEALSLLESLAPVDGLGAGFVMTLPPREHASAVADKRYKVVAVDCEMVTTSAKRLELARVTVIDARGKVVLDTFVKPYNPIVDYNTKYSGYGCVAGHPSIDFTASVIDRNHSQHAGLCGYPAGASAGIFPSSDGSADGAHRPLPRE